MASMNSPVPSLSSSSSVSSVSNSVHSDSEVQSLSELELESELESELEIEEIEAKVGAWRSQMQTAGVPLRQCRIIAEAINVCISGGNSLSLIYEGEREDTLQSFDSRITHLPDIFDSSAFKHTEYIFIANFPGLTALPSIDGFKKVKQITIKGCAAISSISNFDEFVENNPAFVTNNSQHLEKIDVSSEALIEIPSEISALLYPTQHINRRLFSPA